MNEAETCAFCAIARGGDLAVREVYRNAQVVAFFPTEPATLGHTLIIPRAHVRDIWSLDADLVPALGLATLKLAGAIRRVLEPQGLNVIQSNGEAATQTVMHLHIHLVPRWEGDAIGQIWPPTTAYSEAAKDDVWEALLAECRSLEAET